MSELSNFIPVNEKYALSSDTYQWIINRWQPPSKNGRHPGKWVGVSFHAELDQAATSLGRRMLREGKSTSLGNGFGCGSVTWPPTRVHLEHVAVLFGEVRPVAEEIRTNVRAAG